MAKHSAADEAEKKFHAEDERAPLAVTIGTVAGTLALAGMLGVVSLGTMDGMRRNAIDNVRAQVMAGQGAADGQTGSADGADSGDAAKDGSEATPHLGDGGSGAVDANGNPVKQGADDGKGGDKTASDGVDDVVDSSVSVEGSGTDAKGGSGDGANGKSDVYDVEWGDTLSDISRRFGVSVDELATANGIWDPNMIYAGSSIRIPTK